MKIRISGTVNDSIVDGPGLRFTIFTQGCPHHCEGCHTPQRHSFDGGYDDDTNEILNKILKSLLLRNYIGFYCLMRENIATIYALNIRVLHCV